MRTEISTDPPFLQRISWAVGSHPPRWHRDCMRLSKRQRASMSQGFQRMPMFQASQAIWCSTPMCTTKWTSGFTECVYEGTSWLVPRYDPSIYSSMFCMLTMYRLQSVRFELQLEVVLFGKKGHYGWASEGAERIRLSELMHHSRFRGLRLSYPWCARSSTLSAKSKGILKWKRRTQSY